MATIHIHGNLTKDPVMRETREGQQKLCNFTVAENRIKKDPKGNGVIKKAYFYRISAWGTQAENCMKYLTRGRGVVVHGELDVEIPRDQNGNIMFTKTGEPILNLNVNAEGRIDFLGSSMSNEPDDTPNMQANTEDNKPKETVSAEQNQTRLQFVPVETDELPF